MSSQSEFRNRIQEIFIHGDVHPLARVRVLYPQKNRVVMSCIFHHRPRIEKGDLVIVYEDFKSLHAIRVTPPQVFSSRFGKFSHAAMVGRRFGERILSVAEGSGSHASAGGYVYLLSPSPELWTATLPHRTQILYIADISMICLQLELLPGSIVVEAGTGSGSLSHALARCIGSRGHLHTFEFNAQRAQLAAAEFAANGLTERVTCRHGDVCAKDWLYSAHGIAEETVDGVIFDLPQPWDAVERFAPYLRPGGRLCCFSPCIEQVARTLDVLRAKGFTGAEVIEVITRTHEVKTRPESEADAISLSMARGEELRRAREVKEKAAARGVGVTIAFQAAVAVHGAATDGGTNKRPASDGMADAANGAKRRKVDGENVEDRPGGNLSGAAAGASQPAHAHGAGAGQGAVAAPALRTKQNADMRGHTGFLLFCTKHVG